MQPLIRVQQLRFCYPDGTRALDGIDFELHPRETVILFGANGSGKTTFLLHLNGLLTGDGDIEVAGFPVEAAHLPAIRRKVGMVFQDAEAQLFMPTVLEDAAFAPLQYGLPPVEAERRARTALEEVGLEHQASRPHYHLSAGEKRRASIAGVLAMEPEILVFDEPTTYLDPPAQRQLVMLLHRLPHSKIVATHDAAFAAAIGTRAVFFESGRIIAEGSVRELVERFDWRAG